MVMCTFSYNDQWSIMLSRAFFYTVLADMLMPNHQGSLCHSYSKCSKKPTKAISTSLSNQITCQRRPSHLNLTKAPTFAKPETEKKPKLNMFTSLLCAHTQHRLWQRDTWASLSFPAKSKHCMDVTFRCWAYLSCVQVFLTSVDR